VRARALLEWPTQKLALKTGKFAKVLSPKTCAKKSGLHAVAPRSQLTFLSMQVMPVDAFKIRIAINCQQLMRSPAQGRQIFQSHNTKPLHFPH